MSIVITESLMTMALFVNIESFLAVSLVLLVNLAQLHDKSCRANQAAL
ncbi:MAG: hypothetical protein GXZ05_01990 [Gammaproteobacteria bacterium]|nr:hypothetical protein [Gammaproteobacteria bacterium]